MLDLPPVETLQLAWPEGTVHGHGAANDLLGQFIDGELHARARSTNRSAHFGRPFQASCTGNIAESAIAIQVPLSNSID
jgi:hypothetical protein